MNLPQVSDLIGYLEAFCLAVLSYFLLSVFPYYPDLWRFMFCILIFFFGTRKIENAWALLTALVLISAAYHSYEIAILLFLCTLIAGWIKNKYQLPPYAGLMLLAVPFLAGSKLNGAPLRIEFLAVFLFPLLARKNRAAFLSCSACFLAVLAGIVGNNPLIGNIVVGAPGYYFFTSKFPPADMADLKWMVTNASPQVLIEMKQILFESIGFLIQNPVVWIQIGGWGVLSYGAGWLVEKRGRRNDWFYTVFAGLFVMAGLIVLQVTTLKWSRHEIPFDLLQYIIRIFMTGIGFAIICELIFAVRTHVNLNRIRPSSEDIRMLLKGGSIHRSHLPPDVKIKRQSGIKTHAAKENMQIITVLDIGMAESLAVKEGSSPEDILMTFKEYWKFTDAEMLSKGGQLLSRAGDGAAYLFENPDDACQAAGNLIKNLKRFNQEKNKLKGALAVRIGISSGQFCQAARMGSGGDLFGRVMDTAAHLKNLAPSGGICLSEEAYHQLNYKARFIKAGHSGNTSIDYYCKKGP